MALLLSTDLVNPELAHNDVVNSGGHLSPNVVVATGVEFQVDGTCAGGKRRLLLGQRHAMSNQYPACPPEYALSPSSKQKFLSYVFCYTDTLILCPTTHKKKLVDGTSMLHEFV